IGNAPNAFAIESFIDEIAFATGKNPLALRLELARGAPRMQALLRAVAQMSSWESPRAGRGLGIAAIEKDDSLAAAVAEVSIDKGNGGIKVHNFWAAVDAGIAVQPRNIMAQTEGSIVWGLGHVLREEITIRGGRAVQSNFHDYQVTRMVDVPNIETRVMSTDNPPTGIGDCGVAFVAPAVANALFALTGKRLRELPFSAEKVVGALRA
ncbi:MAG: molybdopterin cofactor-binding domain-containing protein, partial [Dongiaceae bacterium]